MTKITDSGLGITAMIQLTMDRADAEEFLQVYKGVVQEYPLMVSELSCGPCIAMEICGQDAQQALRVMAGPPDPVDHTCAFSCFMTDFYANLLSWMMS